jgi:hypothetical protein
VRESINVQTVSSKWSYLINTENACTFIVRISWRFTHAYINDDVRIVAAKRILFIFSTPCCWIRIKD